MDTSTIISLIVVAVFLLMGGGLKKVKEALSEQEAPQQKPRTDYEASPEEIKEFLRGLTAAQRQEVPPPAGPAAAREQALAPARQAVDLGEPLATPLPATAVAPPGPVREGPVRVSAPRPPRSAAPAPRRPGSKAPVASSELHGPRERLLARLKDALQQAPVAPSGPPKDRRAPPAAVQAAAGMPVALRSLSLKQAVIWSEVLGAPVGIRRRRQAARRQAPPSDSQAS